MEDSMDGLHKQQRALRAIEVVALSGFVKYNQWLKESCLAICNSCREGRQQRCLKVGINVPRTLLAVFWPDVLGSNAEVASRVLLPRRVLEVTWTFDDLATMDLMGSEEDIDEEDEDEEDEEDEDEDKQDEDDDQDDNGDESDEGGEDEDEEEDEEKEEEEKEEDEEEDEENEDGDKLEDEATRNQRETKKSDEVGRDLVTACNIDLSKVRWPEGVKAIKFNRFNRPVDNVMWPNCLEVLSFHMPSPLFRGEHTESEKTGIFNMPLDRVTFPAGLREIFLGSKFNQPITGVTWPQGLERLSMPGFNQPIRDVQWPSGLKTLEFVKPYQFEQRQSPDDIPWFKQAGGFDQPLGMSLPMSLETLWLSDDFNQSLRGVTWPSGLTVIGLGTDVTQEAINGVTWPPSLRKIVYSQEMLYIRDPPAGCEVVLVERDGVSDSEEDEEFGMNPWDDADAYEDYEHDNEEYDPCDYDEDDYDHGHEPGGEFYL